jgi:hypothetical protein
MSWIACILLLARYFFLDKLPSIDEHSLSDSGEKLESVIFCVDEEDTGDDKHLSC